MSALSIEFRSDRLAVEDLSSMSHPQAALKVTECGILEPRQKKMERESILRSLRARRDELSQMGVKSLALFGSVARNEARPVSDVDLLIERIEDILECAENIQAFTRGMNLEIFPFDPKTIRAVAFEIPTMGEATRAIPPEIRRLYLQVPWVKMQAIRNVIVHEYFRIDEECSGKQARKIFPR
jgi:uncharacterized protein with HEPN domain